MVVPIHRGQSDGQKGVAPADKRNAHRVTQNQNCQSKNRCLQRPLRWRSLLLQPPQIRRAGAVQFGDNADEVDAKWRELVATEVVVVHKLVLDDVAGLPGDPALDALELLLV